MVKWGTSILFQLLINSASLIFYYSAALLFTNSGYFPKVSNIIRVEAESECSDRSVVEAEKVTRLALPVI